MIYNIDYIHHLLKKNLKNEKLLTFNIKIIPKGVYNFTILYKMHVQCT